MDAGRLRQALCLASAFKEGDLHVGGTADDRLREDARRGVSALTVGEIRRAVLVEDGVTTALQRSRDPGYDADLDGLTIARLKSIVLRPDAPSWVRSYSGGLASEVIAAVVKVMTNDELSAVARTLFNSMGEREIEIGGPQHFGSRIQPNSPGDDESEILFSILEGLSYGCGDVIIGLNPAADELDEIVRLERLLEEVVRRLDLPTRYCVLSDIVKQHEARARARVDVGFQSLAGTSRSLTGMVGLDVDGVAELARGFGGLYFETGQGSEVTNGAAEGVDMVTLESRSYGVARHIRQRVADSAGGLAPWTIVNDVAGFIGPEVFRDKEQLERVCLEDTVMAKLHGLTMGLDVCATFHMGITPAELEELTARIVARAAPAYLMAVAGNADPMLGYLTTSFRQHPSLRQNVSRTITQGLGERLSALGTPIANTSTASHAERVSRLYAAFAKAGSDRRSAAALEHEGRRRLGELRERGFDLGADASASDARLDAIYVNARRALYATLDDEVIREVMPRALTVSTQAQDRDDYLAHPAAGECLREDGVRLVRAIQSYGPPRVQLIVSDGLNANAVNEQLRAVLVPLRRRLADAGVFFGPTEVVVQHGRVRVGYEIGRLVGAESVVHIVGERPGTGLNTLSAYLTYGRDAHGLTRWQRSLDHSATTAICGIHPRGKPPERAAKEIARTLVRILGQRRSGVALASTDATDRGE
jgi:ethanolamine ammonia-lyase large subunit